jgi:predicted transcriptional regulator
MNAMSSKMQMMVAIIEQDIKDGFSKVWHIEDGRLYVESDQGWYVAYDENEE